MELIKSLTKSNAPSGCEESVRNIIIDEVKKFADEIITDTMGNLIVHKKGKGKKLMFAAHMDEIGIMVTHIQDDGFIRFAAVGGVNAYNCINSKVVFANGTTGVVSYEQTNGIKDLKLANMYIDIGASDKESAQKYVNVGDTACFVGDCAFNGNIVISKSLDNRIGCYALIQALKKIKNNTYDLYFTFTVQEEVGLRGARTSAYKINPDMAIAVDVTRTGDTPSSSAMNVKLGSGVAVKVKDASVICHHEVRESLIDVAKKNNIKYQLEVLEKGGTDAGAIHLSHEGVPSGGLSIPTRYIHSSSEMSDLNDVEECIKLIAAFCER